MNALAAVACCTFFAADVSLVVTFTSESGMRPTCQIRKVDVRGVHMVSGGARHAIWRRLGSATRPHLAHPLAVVDAKVQHDGLATRIKGAKSEPQTRDAPERRQGRGATGLRRAAAGSSRPAR